jgi:armadillo repeat-containing protein 7
MFSTQERLQRRTPKEGIGRAEYISLLVDEYYESSNRESCEQVCMAFICKNRKFQI